MKKKVLFVGEHPATMTGNANMMAALLEKLDRNSFDPICFGANIPNFKNMLPFDYPVVPAFTMEDSWGLQKLIDLLATERDISSVVIVGVDIWRHAPIFQHLHTLRLQNRIRLHCICPYDAWSLRKDWLEWFTFYDVPAVYSKYGYDMIRPHSEKIQYFRPPLRNKDQFRILSVEERSAFRKAFFPGLGDKFLIGFVGANQIRKDPQKVLLAFAKAREKNPNICLYLHTNLSDGVYNLHQFAVDCQLPTGSLYAKKQEGGFEDVEKMVGLFNCFDVLLNPSVQEGLSWTPIEAALCGTPSILSASTAHYELCLDENGDQIAWPIIPDQETFVPVVTAKGASSILGYSCSSTSISEKVLEVASDPERVSSVGLASRRAASKWAESPSDINEFLRTPDVVVHHVRKPDILFAQHSSAGDVLMSTQCFKELKAKHPGRKLIYMTQHVFQGIVEGNPYVDDIIDWDQKKLQEYELVYNPHGEKILPGGFNNLDVTLYSMYPYFCGKLKGSPIFINPEVPSYCIFPEKYVLVHTTGGQPEYRTYEHMKYVIKGLDIPVFQIGGASDFLCEGAVDLRGKLSWRETAWAMEHAKAAVVIDSFPSHLAGAMGTPAIVLYGPAPARVVQPRDDKGVLIHMEPNKLDVCPITSNCWGHRPDKQKCQSPCINTIHPLRVRKNLIKLLEG